MESPTGYTLPEELLLFLLPANGKLPRSSSGLEYGLSGAVLLELGLRERIQVVNDQVARVNLEIAVVDLATTGDDLLDGALEEISGSSVGRLRFWLKKLRPGGKRLSERVAERLVARNAVGSERRRVLGLFPRQRYPVRDSTPREAIVDRLTAVLLAEGEPDARTRFLIGVADANNMIDMLVPEDQLMSAKDRAWRLQREEVASTQLVPAVRNAVSRELLRKRLAAEGFR